MLDEGMRRYINQHLIIADSPVIGCRCRSYNPPAVPVLGAYFRDQHWQFQLHDLPGLLLLRWWRRGREMDIWSGRSRGTQHSESCHGLFLYLFHFPCCPPSKASILCSLSASLSRLVSSIFRPLSIFCSYDVLLGALCTYLSPIIEQTRSSSSSLSLNLYLGSPSCTHGCSLRMYSLSFLSQNCVFILKERGKER